MSTEFLLGDGKNVLKSDLGDGLRNSEYAKTASPTLRYVNYISVHRKLGKANRRKSYPVLILMEGIQLILFLFWLLNVSQSLGSV